MHLQLIRSRGTETETEARLRREGTGDYAVTGDRRSIDSLSFHYFDRLTILRRDEDARLVRADARRLRQRLSSRQ